MSFNTAVKEYGLVGVFRRLYCLFLAHDYYIGRVCLHCNEQKGRDKK